MRLDEIEFLARHGVLRDFQLELDCNVMVLLSQSCPTSFLCSSGPARTIPFPPALPRDRVQLLDKPGSAEFVQDEPTKRGELMFRQRCLCDQQHAVKPSVDEGDNIFLGQHWINRIGFMSVSNRSVCSVLPERRGVSHRAGRCVR